MVRSHDRIRTSGVARLLSWRRLRPTLLASLIASIVMRPGWHASYGLLLARWLFVGLLALLAFGWFEEWPARLPRWLSRWAWQIVGVAFAMPAGAFVAYIATTLDDPVMFWHNSQRLSGFASMTVLGLLVAPWMAVTALVRHINGEAQRQALGFALERSELERKALDARLRLLQAQVEPHFLFNTLANVRELVDSGSPQASAVLNSLIAYLRAAVPRLQESATTMGQELELVRAYLEVMHMRMPDRLQFVLDAEESLFSLNVPPMTLLTLVENAVRHGIDPSEKGGRIEICILEKSGRCIARVIDTGVGLRQNTAGLGTGLTTLLERLQLTFGGDAQLRLTALAPRGVCAELEFPARRGAT
ncbi:MAG: histidine kinase [Tahibacter sp.]